MFKKPARAFTLIELLVVILILGILLAIAIPAYLNSVRDSRVKTANSNAKSIANAVQSIYVKNNGASYDTAVGSTSLLIQELGGAYPDNPCTAAVENASTGSIPSSGYTVTSDVDSFSIVADDGENCNGETMTPIYLGAR